MNVHTTSGDATPWYAVWTRSRHERVVRQQLTEKNIEVFLPTVRRLSRWSDRRKRIEWPLFPGYCFARFDPQNPLPVLKCAGVLNILSVEGKPAPVADKDISALRRLVSTELPYGPCSLLPEGTLIDVVAGPLCGISGRLLHNDAQRATVVLSVDLIRHAVKVEVDAADVRPH